MKTPAASCKRGHLFTVANTLIKVRKDGRTHRSCRACHRLEQQRYLAKTPRKDAYEIWSA